MNKNHSHRHTALGWILSISLAVGPFATNALATTPHLQVSAAMSLEPALREVVSLFVRTHPGVEVRINAAASGRLRMQIEAGAPTDVFFSASARQMDILETKGLVVAGTRENVLTNGIVLVTPVDAPEPLWRLQELMRPAVRRVALGSPRSVPAGRYAEEALRRLGLWTVLSEKLVFAENVRQVLDYVVRGEVDAGFLYRTDALSQAASLRVIASLPPQSHGHITYPAAVIKGSGLPEKASAFVRFLSSDGARAIFRGHGFGIEGGVQ